MEGEEPPTLRPEEMVPYVREYIGLLRDKEVMEHEIKRCFSDYKKTREKLLHKKKPIDDRFGHVEDILKRTIHQQNLPGVKYKNYIFSLEGKTLYKRPEDKIAEALERNQNMTNDKKTLAKLIADAVKKKCKRVSDGSNGDYKNMVLRIREFS